MISKRDSKPFKIKFPIGITKTNKVDMQYQTEWKTVYGLVGEPNGSIYSRIYGNEFNYDKVIIVNAGVLTRSISYDTAVLIDNMPSNVFENGDYKIKYIKPEYNGEIVIGLNKIEPINIPKLYFMVGENVLYYQLNFDSSTLKAYIPKTSNIKFNIGDYVWTREPNPTNLQKNRLRLLNASKAGLGDGYKPFTELTFVEG